MRRYTVRVTTDGSGDATAYTPRIRGLVHQIEYVKPGAASYTDGVDFTITGEATGVNLWTEANVNASAIRAPRQPVHSQVGAASLYAAGGTAVQDRVAVAADRIKIVIAQGGAAKVGTFHVLVDDR